MGVKPVSLFSTDPFSLELADLATETAVDIAKAYDWETLKVLATMTGDGAAATFNFPDDYDRMLLKGKIHSKNWQTANFSMINDEDDWIYLKQTGLSGTPGSCIILGGKLEFFPVLPVGETARFYYISNKIVGGTKTAFTADADTFQLSERLLTLGLIWRWRAQKRMEYAEDMANYEKALAEEIARDRGPRVLTVGRRRTKAESIAYPGVLGPT